MLFVILMLSSFSAFSAVPVQYGWSPPAFSELFQSQNTDQVPFFKSKNSHFASGYASYDKLLESATLRENGESFYLAKDHKKLALRFLPTITAFDLSKTWIEKYTKKRVVAKPDMNLIDVILNYQTDPYDRGLVMTLQSTTLQNVPQAKYKKLALIKAGTKLIPIRFENGFVQVLYQKKYGYIDMNLTMSKFDFAKFIYSVQSEQKNWEAVSQREFDQIVTSSNVKNSNKKYIQMNAIQGLIVDETLALSHTENLHYPMWSQFHIHKEKTRPWIQSKIKGHGLVWWQKNEIALANSQNISIDELLKKEIYSVSFQAGNPKKAIASISSGVFMTDDGQTWKPLNQFKGFVGPVYYFNDHYIFVGNYRSQNGGKTFDQYIQIDKISQAIRSLGFEVKKVKLSRIKVQKPYNVVIDLDIGYRTLRMKSPLFAQDWKLQKY